MPSQEQLYNKSLTLIHRHTHLVKALHMDKLLQAPRVQIVCAQYTQQFSIILPMWLFLCFLPFSILPIEIKTA